MPRLNRGLAHVKPRAKHGLNRSVVLNFGTTATWGCVSWDRQKVGQDRNPQVILLSKCLPGSKARAPPTDWLPTASWEWSKAHSDALQLSLTIPGVALTRLEAHPHLGGNPTSWWESVSLCNLSDLKGYKHMQTLDIPLYLDHLSSLYTYIGKRWYIGTF